MSALNEEILNPDAAPGADAEADEAVDAGKRRLFSRSSLQGESLQREIEEAQAELEATQISPVDIVADFIRQRSMAGTLVTHGTFLLPPYSISEKALDDVMQAVFESKECGDIVVCPGEQERYYYSTQGMSTNYANMCVLVMEKDICKTIAHAVRFECETYPRPYKVAMLTQEPYRFSPEEIEAALAAIDSHPDYADIRPVSSSNDVDYLFSERFMSFGKAYGLCEWLEVEQFQNP